ncbi:MAG: adaptor protein MecA [bacterium]|nr:adaptor protein MecA [bacterium]MCM1375549.1 adaptor protein MecA [Muribaculum sp.]
MKIERVDEKTVKCFISNEELEEYDISYKDFMTRSDKAREIVEEIMAQAVEEVDYKPPQYAFDLQIMMMPDKGMILTFTERSPEDVKNGLDLMHYLREMRRILKERLGLDAPTIASLLAQAMVMAAAGGDAAGQSVIGQDVTEATPPVHNVQPEVSRPRFAIFRFDHMRQLCDYARALPRNLRVVSRLYRDGQAYYLYLERGGASYERYSRASIQALEFGELYAASEDKLVYLEEHGECLIDEKAVAKLRL